MKKLLIFVAAALIMRPAFIFPQDQNKFSLSLQSPSPRTILEITGKPFYITGMITPAGASMEINGSKADVDEDGAFLGFAEVMLSKKEGRYVGKFNFKITYKNKSREFKREFLVKTPLATFPADSLAVDKGWNVLPDRNQSLPPGKFVKVEVKSAPGAKAFFKVDGIDKVFPMTETSIVNNYIWGDAVFGSGFNGIHDSVAGIYWGEFKVPAGLKNAGIKITVTDEKSDSLTVAAPGKISAFDDDIPFVVRTKSLPNRIVGRYGPGKGYKLFLDGGIDLLVTGRIGHWLRCNLSGDETVYIPSEDAVPLPEGTPAPHSSIYIIRTQDSTDFVNVNLGLTQRCPYKIIEHNNPQSIELLVYNTTSNIDWIFYDKKSDFIRHVKWDQPKDNVLRVNIFLNEKTHWGYSTVYDGNVLKLKIKKPAKRNSGFLFWDNQLKGRVISLDPGHNPETGAVGPRGTLERDVNLKITMQLKKMLEDAGAVVYLTHTTEPLPLRQRKMRVNSFDPEISISIHNNAVPQGVDPIIYNGSSVYYYYLQSKPLAEMIHRNFIKNLGLYDLGLYWDNLYMSRIPESISLLVEPAFMIEPHQEKMLLDAGFREKIAKSIFNALKEFYEEYSQ